MKSFFEKYFNSIMPLHFIFNCVTIVGTQIIWLWMNGQKNAMLFTALFIFGLATAFIYIFSKFKDELTKKDMWIVRIFFTIFLIMFIIALIVNIKTSIMLILTFVSMIVVYTMGNCIRLVSKNIFLELISVGIGICFPIVSPVFLLVQTTWNDGLKLLVAFIFLFAALFLGCMEDTICRIERDA